MPLKGVTFTNDDGDEVLVWRSSNKPTRPYWQVNGEQKYYRDTLPYKVREGSLEVEFYVELDTQYEPGSDGRLQSTIAGKLVMNVCGEWEQTSGATDIW